MAAWDPSASIINQDVTDGTGLVSAATRTRSNSAFVRELWEDEIIAAYKSNLIMPQLSVVMDHNRQKGDTIHVPNPSRGAATAKATQTAVTLIANQESTKQYLIDNHYHYARMIEDVVKIQADDSLRRFYTDDAGYGLAKAVDTEMHQVAAFLNAAGIGTQTDPTKVAASAYNGAVVGALSTADALVQWDSTTDGNAAALTDAAIRKFIQTLDDNDVPVAGRYLVIPPVEKNNLLGITRYTEQAFTGEIGMSNSIRNGRVGDIYGVEVFVSTNCESVTDASSNTDQRAALLFQEEALLLIEQLRPRAQTQYKLEWTADLFVSDTLFGTGVLRPEAGLAIVVPA